MSFDKVVSSASYYGDELRKPVYGVLLPFLFPTPRRPRRQSHLGLDSCHRAFLAGQGQGRQQYRAVAEGLE